VRRRLDGERLLRAVTAFFAANLLLFWAAALAACRSRSRSSSG